MDGFPYDDLSTRICEMVADISGDDTVSERPDEDLFEEDTLDSMAAIELLVTIEDELGVQIAPTEVPREQMNTLRKVVDRVRERQ